MDFGAGQNLSDGKVTKKKETKKQEFMDIVNHIENLEDKVNLLLENIDKSQSLNYNKRLYSPYPTKVIGGLKIPFSPAGLSPGSGIDNAYQLKDTMSDTKTSSENLPLKNPETPSLYKISSKNTPLNFLADVITSQHEQNLISERILLEEQWNNKPTPPSHKTMGRSDSLNTNNSTISHKSLKPAANNLNITETWNELRQVIPTQLLQLYDSIPLEEMFIDSAKEDTVYKLLEKTQIKPIPDIKIMEKMIDLFLNYHRAHILLPLESFDLLGILNKWKFDGLKRLNHSHLLILNVVGSFMCKGIKCSIFLKDDIRGKEMRDMLQGFELSLLNKVWLTTWEDYFLANSLLHYQSITMFPDGLASVQGIIMLLMYIPLTGLNLSESLMQTSAIRICQDLGLHSEKFLNIINKNKKLLRDKKKKIWWFCCFSDEMLSMLLLKPRMIIHYTSSIQFRNDDKTKVLELLEQELDKEVILQKLNEKTNKFNEVDNSEIIENLKTQIRDTLIRIYKEDGIFMIMKYYFFKIINIIQKNVTKIEKKWDATIIEEILDDFINFSNNLPVIIKDPELIKHVWGDDCFFLYFIHVSIFFIQDHSYSLLYATDDSREYIDFIKQHLDLFLKIKSCKKFYNAMFSIFDRPVFYIMVKILRFHLMAKKFNFEDCLQDYQFLKHFLNEYMGNQEKEENGSVQGNDIEGSTMNTIQDLDPWLKIKKDGFCNLLELFKQIGLHESQNFNPIS